MSSVAGERTLVLLRYIIENEDGLSIREASRTLGYSPATVQKLIGSLYEQGFVVKDDITDRYQLGPEAVRLGFSALARLDIRRAARPYIEALSDKTGETVFLAIRRGNYAVYIDKAVSKHPIRMDAPLGVDRPYNCTAIGKILLTGIAEEDIDRMAAEKCFEARTPNSIMEPAKIKAEIKRIRRQGWAEDKEEYVIGAYCIATPIYNFNGEIEASVTVSGPTHRIKANLDSIIEEVKSAAQKVSVEIGFVQK
jgi:IclR family KDG regulon transcriptional repressor